MAAFFGGGRNSRAILDDDQILQLLGDGNLSDIEDLNDEYGNFDPSEDLNDTAVRLASPPLDAPLMDTEITNASSEVPSTSRQVPVLSRTRTRGSRSTVIQERRSPPLDDPVIDTEMPSTSRQAPALSRTRSRGSRTTVSQDRRKSRRQGPYVHNRSSTAMTATNRSASVEPPTRRRAVRTTRATKKNAEQIPWKNVPFEDKDHDYPSYPTKEVKQPVEYFKEYFDDDFFEMISRCTNLYYMRKIGKELKTTRAEIMRLIAIHVLMGCLPYPRMPMYWRTGISLEKITSLMSRDRFLNLRNALHVVESDDPPAGNSNVLWKVQPIIDKLRAGCQKLERVPGFYSIDEQMIPFTGRCALRQVVKNKPRPVGLKNFVLATSDGLMLDFEVYRGGKSTVGEEMSLGLGPAVILHLSRSVPTGSCIYHDRYFTTIPLVEELAKRNLHSTGTILFNRIPDKSTMTLKSDKNMQRGEHQQLVRGSAVLVKWKDNKGVLMALNCTSAQNTSLVRRWEKKSRVFIEVSFPQIVTQYNKNMGGVDLVDQQMEYYRTFIKTRKWTLKVINHFFDLAIVNSWRAYKLDAAGSKYPRNQTLDLLDFRLEVFEALAHTPESDRPEATEELPLRPRNYQKVIKPSNTVRSDGYDHFPQFDDIKSPRACQNEKCTSRTKVRCIKCNVYLCIMRQQNCFLEYHK